LALAKVFDFARRRRTQRRSRRRQLWLSNAPWPPLAALIGVAGALWFAAALHLDAAGGNDAGALNRNGDAALHGDGVDASGGNGVFTLCAQASQPNCVIDGDTIRYGGIKIRLADIDAPETHEPKCTAEAVRGRDATLRLLELMNAGPFELVEDGVDEDRYGRKLRTIERGGRSLGDVLIAEGLARRWDGARRSWCGSQAF
jgi:micrococcal nuclease